MIFSRLKEKQQKAYRVRSNDDILTNTLITMFAYAKLPDELLERQNMAEDLLLNKGAVGVWNFNNTQSASGDKSYDGEWIFSEVMFTGAPDVYGIGADLIACTENGVCKEFSGWRKNPDIAVIFNNSSFSPDMNIGKTSDLLTEIEVSEKLQVIFSRLYPIPIAKNSKAQAAIEAAIKNMLDGKIATILDEDKLSKYIEDATKSAIESVALTEPEKVQYLQYLSQMHDDVFRRFYGLYGMDESGNAKMAQQSVSEVERNTESSMILPYDMYKWRKRGIDMCNEKFGWNAEVMFSECWQSRDADIEVTDEITEEEKAEDGISEDSTDNSNPDTEDKKSEEVEKEEKTDETE